MPDAVHVLAAVRPNDWDLPLFLHIFGALATVGAVSTAAFYLFRSARDSSAALARVGYLTLGFAAVPAYLVMRVAAQWLLSKEGLEDSEDAWVTIGFIVSDIGLLVLIVATVTAAIASRRAEGAVGRLPSISAWLLSFLLVAYTIAVWAMATKPV